jgi:hypothetical protein
MTNKLQRQRRLSATPCCRGEGEGGGESAEGCRLLERNFHGTFGVGQEQRDAVDYQDVQGRPAVKR